MATDLDTGDPFDKNWRERAESYYTHWTKGEPANQIQLAFRNHWEVFQELMQSGLFHKGQRCLEVGCGRGSMSAYFSAAGFDCTLLDISPPVIEIAKQIFARNNLKAHQFVVGDANQLPFPDGSFDLVFSIGLLEHFEAIELPIQEQIRVLASGGLFIAYVIPKYIDNIQQDYQWMNRVLQGYWAAFKSSQTTAEVLPKTAVYRSDADSSKYLKILKQLGLKAIQASGVYPLPMISHSIEFPFTLMPEDSENAVVQEFTKILAKRRLDNPRHPWFCQEGYGQAFLVWGYK